MIEPSKSSEPESQPPSSLGLEIICSGRVQGVGLRSRIAQKAGQLGVRGTVENLPDGRVRVLVLAPRKEARAFLAWLSGLPEIEQMASQFCRASEGVSGFRILW